MINFEELSAILPHYTLRGDTTGLYFKTGQVTETPRKVHSLLQRIAASYICDLTALRHQSSLRTGQTILQPLPFSAQLLLVAVKIRNSRVPGDFTYAYVNKYAVKKIQSSSQLPYHTEILLTGNHRILSLLATKTVQHAMRQADLATLSPTADGQMILVARQIIALVQSLLNWHA
jgi:hypothetical protein